MIDTVQMGEEVEVLLQYHYMQLIGSLHYTTKKKKVRKKEDLPSQHGELYRTLLIYTACPNGLN